MINNFRLMKISSLKHLSCALTCTLACVLPLGLLTACSSSQQAKTLVDIDLKDDKRVKVRQKKEKAKQVDTEKVKEAYYSYLQKANKGETTRLGALNRLAQIEFDLSSRLLNSGEQDIDTSNVAYMAGLKKTVELLEISLRDFPNDKNVDSSLYQLARAQSQLGLHDDAIDTLRILASKHQRSKHYAEAQFRIAEYAFVRGDFISAEDAYTEVILTPLGERFYEKSLFKRGWTRYKQQLYQEALDDYFAANEESSRLQKASNGARSINANQQSEYFRAMALSFTNLSQKNAVHEYMATQTAFGDTYALYKTIANIYLKQERYTDADRTHIEFRTHNPQSSQRAESQLESIAIWRKADLVDKLYQNIDQLYQAYAPSSAYWKGQTIPDHISEKLREYIVLAATNRHADYLKAKKENEKTRYFLASKKWYDAYLTHYKNYANQLKIYSRYAELLNDVGKTAQALELFELAAFDGEIILDKESAYSAIVINNEHYAKETQATRKARLLQKITTYSKRFTSLYPNDTRSSNVALSAAELNFDAKRYTETLALAEFAHTATNKFTLSNLRARAYFELADYENAEQLFLETLSSNSLAKAQVKTIENSIAIAIYKQAEQAKGADKSIDAYRHFSRITQLIPQSPTAAKGLYEAILIAMDTEQWTQAINDIELFERHYPSHILAKEVKKNLTVAYLKVDQGDKAASIYIALARNESDENVKRASLWKAGELFENKNKLGDAIKAYRDYANTFARPFPENMEAMHKLAELYGRTRDTQKQHFWQNKILQVNAKNPEKLQTDRTLYIASNTATTLADNKKAEFMRIKLKAPFATSLKKKKNTMQEAVTLYGKASSFGLEEISSKATYEIGHIYYAFSKALLNSERPKNLNDDEFEQYNILLEDQAFPFEDKAIELHEANMTRTPKGIYNEWIQASLESLRVLFPTRYARQNKLGVFIDG